MDRTGEFPDPAGSPSLTDVARFLGALGSAMVTVGAPVDGVHARLLSVAHRYGANAVIVVLPTVVLIELNSSVRGRAQVNVSSPGTETMRFDQVDALYRLLSRCAAETIDPADGLRELEGIRAMPPLYPAPVRVLGHGLLAAGFSLMLQPSALQVGVCFVLGFLIGCLKLAELPNVDLVLPFFTAFGVSLVAFTLSEHVEALEYPLGIMIPPLITFLPAGAMTTGTAELASGQMIAGSGRLVSGLVRLGLLSFAIIAAAVVTNVPPIDPASAAIGQLGVWAPWLGIVLLAAGNVMHFVAPLYALRWIGLVLVTAYVGQLVGSTVFDPVMSGFFGAFAMTPLVLWLSRRPSAPPSIIMFLPGFWLLVPGATGLIGVTEMLGADDSSGGGTFAAAVLGIMAIALGALVAASLFRAAVIRRDSRSEEART